jgi:hypothetical protein
METVSHVFVNHLALQICSSALMLYPIPIGHHNRMVVQVQYHLRTIQPVTYVGKLQIFVGHVMLMMYVIKPVTAVRGHHMKKSSVIQILIGILVVFVIRLVVNVKMFVFQRIQIM